MNPTFTAVSSALLLSMQSMSADAIQVLLIDGQNNHQWKETTPVLVDQLTEVGFEVEVATAPPQGADMSGFRPEFSRFDVVVSNYNGDLWPESTRQDFEQYVKSGGGFVSVHAANNAFREWPAYNEMIGLGGWGGRTEEDGPYLYWKERFIRDNSPGRGGSHGRQHEFVLDVREPEHPIMKGIPLRWKHTQDELYDRLRGPAENLTVLATAWSDPATNGSGRHEPLIMVLRYGEGRIFHTALGHYLPAIQGVGFATTFQRGTEWAATGKVTIPVPENFPTEEETASRQ